MNFSMLPPEVNSALMFSGAGSAPMLAAAAAWNGLAEELASAASSFAAVTSGLTARAWQGPAAAAMTAAAAPYASWLNSAATHATGAAGQAQAVADVFDSTRAATIPPPLVAGNRDGLLQLVTANFFGQNAPAIAAAEAEYEQMWAQDVSAMVGYHAGASAAATQLAPWLQALRELSGRLAALLGLNPVTNPVPGDPDLMSQTTVLGPISTTSLADLSEDFVATTISTPVFTARVTSGFESTLGLGAPGHTVIAFQSPVLPFLNGSIALPVTDPLAPLFAALLPLGF